MNFETELTASNSHGHLHPDTDDCSRQASSSPYSGKAKFVSGCGLGEMYDPFVDSFEPLSMKLDCAMEHELVNDLDSVPKTSISSNRPVNVGLDCVQEHEPDGNLCTVPKASVCSNTLVNVEVDCVQEHELVNNLCSVPNASISSNRPLNVEVDCVQEHEQVNDLDLVPKASISSNQPVSVEVDCVQEREPVNNLYSVQKASLSSNRPLNVEENNQGVDKQALSESDMTTRLSVSSNKPPDVEDNTTRNEIEAVVYGDNEEFAETAENERIEGNSNSHENGTPNSHNENLMGHDNGHEDDNTRKKSGEKSKDKELPRSTKLFKVVLTKFVKDLLKPSWKQGNMSKEAFKTIVKRAVEKVSNSMEGRRMPKSRAKIDRYIDTSRHKLTKLVMGYVDKYVKA